MARGSGRGGSREAPVGDRGGRRPAYGSWESTPGGEVVVRSVTAPRSVGPSTDVRSDHRRMSEWVARRPERRPQAPWPATRSPSSAPAMSARRPRSASRKPASPTSSSSTSSKACRRARASTWPRRRPVVGHDARITGTNDYADTAGSDIIVVTSGLARQPGMSRDDLLAKNAGIVGAVVEQAARHSPNAILIVVTNPLDAMCHVAHEGVGLPARACPRAWPASSTRLASARSSPRSWASRSRTPTPSSSAAMATRWCRCRATRRWPAFPITELMTPERVAALVRADRQRRRGGRGPAQDRLGLLRAGGLDVRDGRVDPARSEAGPALRGPARGRVRRAGLFVGVPVVLGAGGMERVFEIELTADEQAAFDASAAAVQELVNKLG